ncbi:phosphogluconate dehydratase [Telmatospirillum siberiense]|uniref:Phosphogluconate dehydratase n=1 Tax=Telmatospirillum siberiense TaxID=382514 RepID=A0A2N3PXV4_9PROT|nr:phosphogluconate dehydratase [Telmatospirillum siberiense]PKU25243.1 phosphogluconate dehydratase [Telmatospirillum siberiense]
MPLDPRIAKITQRIRERSRDSRAAYLRRTEAVAGAYPPAETLSCANFAHAIAALNTDEKVRRTGRAPNIGIVTAYNDMLSAHQPFAGFPEIIKDAAWKAGGVAQVAGGVPAMCDGITQGQPGMELSLFSRDAIAMGTAIALSHNSFDAALMLGVCDKIVPGLLIGALQFGHLPVIFVPAGPMSTGLSNAEKSRVRQLYATGKIGRDALLDSETKSYHGPGTCTFYGTANSNQLLMEVMGLHLPGSAFVHPGSPLREALTRHAAERVLSITARSADYTPIARVVDERAIVNGIVALMATGGSTNHTIHLVAIAAAAGIRVTWDDFDEISRTTPLLARIYPNGPADINLFHAAGGMGFLIGQLLDAGLLDGEVTTVAGGGLGAYRRDPLLLDGGLAWRDGPGASLDTTVLRGLGDPFDDEGGLRLLKGNLGRGVMKISAVAEANRRVRAPALLFDSQAEFVAAHKEGRLERDFVAVLRFQGPRANGMPELHALTPILGALQDAGHRVALITDGRMSGATGKIPMAIHISPEVIAGGPLGRVREGDMILLDANAGVIEAEVDSALWEARAATPPAAPVSELDGGFGHALFGLFRAHALPAEEGASSFG